MAASATLPCEAEIRLPALTAELRPLNEKPTPSMEDARQTILALTQVAAASPEPERQAVNDLINQIKQPFVAEFEYQSLVRSGPQHQASLTEARKSLERLEKNPPRRVGGAVDIGHKSLYMQQAHDKAVAAEHALEEIKLGAGRLAGHLATTNSLAAAYLRMGRQDIAISLASSLFSVAERQNVSLEFEPALSYAWVRMKKLSEVEREVERNRSSKLLAQYVAIHEGAKAINGMSADYLYKSAKNGDLVGSIVSFAILREGLKQQARFDQTINFCLEVVFFQPEPSDYAAKMRIVLDKVLQPISGKSAGERFAENIVHDTLAAVDTKYATPEIVKGMMTILSAGLEAVKQAR
ncbi:hypothetical protein [Prosthecobacter sp.]|uniref:hypothetical protein n=1 Tax=Prosthecobacter sp. TaxID=1965333 RepID=UPI003784D76E